MELKLSEYQQNLLEQNVFTAEYQFAGVKHTICVLTLPSGFEVLGKSAVEDASKFDANIGKHFALVDALNQLDAYLSFKRQEEKFQLSY